MRKQRVLACHVHWTDVTDLPSELRFHLLAEVSLILDNPRYKQWQPAPLSHLDREMDTLVGVNTAEEHQVLTYALLKRI